MAYTQSQLAELRAGALASVANLEALHDALAVGVADDERRRMARVDAMLADARVQVDAILAGDASQDAR